MLSRTTTVLSAAVLSAALRRRGQRCSKAGLGGHRVSFGEPGRKGKPIKYTTRDNSTYRAYCA